MIRCCFSGVQTGGHTHSSGCTEMTKPPAAAPLADDRTKCEKWCGMRAGDLEKMEALGYYAGLGLRIGDGDARRWCSERCLAARLPSLAAQPAETKPLTCVHGATPGMCSDPRCQPAETLCQCTAFGDGEHVRVLHCDLYAKRKSAPQPAPAKEPVCRCGAKASAIGWCNPCWNGFMNWSRIQTGTPYTGPERIERPKLAHSSMWADEAEDVS